MSKSGSRFLRRFDTHGGPPRDHGGSWVSLNRQRNAKPVFAVRARPTPRASGGCGRGVLAFGAVLPDLVDKPLAWQFDLFETGYAVAHSAFVVVPALFVVYVLARRRRAGPLVLRSASGTPSTSLAMSCPPPFPSGLWISRRSCGQSRNASRSKREVPRREHGRAVASQRTSRSGGGHHADPSVRKVRERLTRGLRSRHSERRADRGASARPAPARTACRRVRSPLRGSPDHRPRRRASRCRSVGRFRVRGRGREFRCRVG